MLLKVHLVLNLSHLPNIIQNELSGYNQCGRQTDYSRYNVFPPCFFIKRGPYSKDEGKFSMFSREKGYKIRAKVHARGGENDPNGLPVSQPDLEAIFSYIIIYLDPTL